MRLQQYASTSMNLDPPTPSPPSPLPLPLPIVRKLPNLGLGGGEVLAMDKMLEADFDFYELQELGEEEGIDLAMRI